MPTRQSWANKERRGRCSGCGREEMTATFRGKRLCRSCMIGDEEPLRLSDYLVGTCPLGNLSGMEGEVPGGVGAGSAFSKKLDRSMKRNGFAYDDVRLVYGAGAADTQAEKEADWKREFGNQGGMR